MSQPTRQQQTRALIDSIVDQAGDLLGFIQDHTHCGITNSIKLLPHLDQLTRYAAPMMASESVDMVEMGSLMAMAGTFYTIAAGLLLDDQADEMLEDFKASIEQQGGRGKA